VSHLPYGCRRVLVVGGLGLLLGGADLGLGLDGFGRRHLIGLHLGRRGGVDVVRGVLGGGVVLGVRRLGGLVALVRFGGGVVGRLGLVGRLDLVGRLRLVRRGRLGGGVGEQGQAGRPSRG
jgi:hypothetical protein